MRHVPCTLGLLLLALALPNACNPVPAEGAQVMALAGARMKQKLPRLAPGRPVTLPTVLIAPEPHPLAELRSSELQALVRLTPNELGSISIGRANRGALFNGVPMPDGEHWELVNPDRSWATEESVTAISNAIHSVVSAFPDSPKLYLGDMSKRRGGYFRPHRSHQSGRDADLGYYYTDEPGWYKVADADNLDRARTWALVKSLLTQGSVEYLFIDRSVQDLLEEHALRVENDKAWVEELFSHPGGKAAGTLRHVRGHKTHMHVRFFSDTARDTARRTYSLLARYGKI